MVDIRRSEDNGFSWHIARDKVGVYIRAYNSDAINIPTQDAIDIAHAILDLVEFDSDEIGRIR